MMGFRCAVYTHVSLVPLEIHHVWPKGEGGPDTAENRVSLCANGHGAIHDLLAKMLKGPVPWRTRVKYGFRVRRYAKFGHRAITEGVPPW